MTKAKIIKLLTLIAKGAGAITALNMIPFVSPDIGVLVFLVASLVKDTVNRVGDLADDGIKNDSFKS